MPRNRTPARKAEVAGANLVHPERFNDRKAPKARALGKPYATLSEGQLEVWTECAENMPWLQAHHRLILRQVCILADRMNTNPDIGVSALQALSAALSKLGATPVDDTKVNHGDSGEEDSADRFFARPN